MTAVYQVQLLKPAVRSLQRLDKSVGVRVVQRMNWLGENLDSITPIPLTGDLAGLYKLREGDYRIVYEVLHKEQTIIVHLIGHRRDIYQRR
jgi:mRNA interferase RelE/StbE